MPLGIMQFRPKEEIENRVHCSGIDFGRCVYGSDEQFGRIGEPSKLYTATATWITRG